MEQLKPCLKKLERTNQFFNEIDRTQYIRMDGNESIDGLPGEFVKRVLDKITPEMLATYPNPKRCIEAIANYLNVDREQVLVTNGSDAAIKLFFETYVGETDNVVIASPAFEMYEVYCNMHGANAINVKYNENFEFPLQDYIEKISNGAKLAIITNPNNPTGSVIDRSTIREILDAAKKHNALVMIDEAYHWIYSDTALSLISEYKNLVILRTFSKLLGLAGVRLGFAVANVDMVSDIKKVVPPAGVNTIALLFGEEIMNTPDLIDGLIRSFHEEKSYMKERLKGMGIKFVDTESNYILIPMDRSKAQTVIGNLKDKGILVAYKMNRYLRVNVGNKESVDRFFSAIETEF